ncbi:hypothetical protein EIN_133300 [Entamoeba invadens IP1]|uniref:Uncharacterized protein n=1 Tax=Entamoeba invadens IP1 TaxID=370355 RepID=L7FL30_ENTIV|nr:hypothetical protein EIN_133300 [Entamoeba invadens IP1]ELP86661.1 hypothetical protein EIN_133300 [Entamoeba invadens IP1]|eukprot:XP_004186007.1 hypothetical protein EIN_133300 [Entamoeba invadens IP1]
MNDPVDQKQNGKPKEQDSRDKIDTTSQNGNCLTYDESKLLEKMMMIENSLTQIQEDQKKLEDKIKSIEKKVNTQIQTQLPKSHRDELLNSQELRQNIKGVVITEMQSFKMAINVVEKNTLETLKFKEIELQPRCN